MIAEVSSWAEVASEALSILGPALAALLLAAAAMFRARANAKARDALHAAIEDEVDPTIRKRIKKTAVYQDANLKRLLESKESD